MFEIGDVVQCKVDYYSAVNKGDYRIVLGIDPPGLIVLKNHKSPTGTAHYDPNNFILIKREKKTMNKFIGINVNDNTDINSLDSMTLNSNYTTSTSHTHAGVVNEITKEMQNNPNRKKWLVVQVLSVVEPEEPKPPVKITPIR